jgi:hypothetical protein
VNLHNPSNKPAKLNWARRKRHLATLALSIFMIVLLVLQLAAGLIRTRPIKGIVPATTAADSVASEQDKAQLALQSYFSLLSNQHFEEATSYYGGSYDKLAHDNPASSHDYATLLKDACNLNGYQCLPLRSIKAARQIDANTFEFSVEFTTQNGGLLSRDSGGASQYEFPFTVVKSNGRYLVQELPVQLP